MIGKINIQGAIGFFENEQCVELIDVISQVKKQPNATSFEVIINSDGGHVDVGFDIYNYLKKLGLPITTIGSGVVASIATVIFMAGSKRIVKPNTKFMIHAPMGSIEFATAEELDAYSKHLKNTENELASFYSKELGLSKEAVSPLLRKDTWINQEQLIDLGFVTTNNSMRISARVNKPKINKQMSKTSKFQAILNILKGGEVVNKVIFSADQNKEIVFPDLGENDSIEVGAKATYDGVPAGGTEEEPAKITGADGIVYVFVDSILVEKITETTEEEVTEEEMIDALAQTLEVAVELDKRVQTLETETVAIKKERDEFKAKFETATATIAKLKGASPTVQTTVTNRSGQQATTSSVVANWKNNKLKKN